MVGGRIIGLVHRHDGTKLPKDPHNDGTTLIHVEDTNGDTCWVRCRGKYRTEMDVGDQVWWQCGQVYWTPAEPSSVFVGGRHLTSKPGGKRQGIDFDVPLEKVGYSH